MTTVSLLNLIRIGLANSGREHSMILITKRDAKNEENVFHFIEI